MDAAGVGAGNLDLDPATGLSRSKLHNTKHVELLHWWLIIRILEDEGITDLQILALAVGYTQAVLVGCMDEGIEDKVAVKMKKDLPRLKPAAKRLAEDGYDLVVAQSSWEADFAAAYKRPPPSHIEPAHDPPAAVEEDALSLIHISEPTRPY